MIRFIHLSIFSVLLFLPGPASKKEQLLQLSKKYFPENFKVLKEYDEVQINNLARGDSLKHFLGDIATIVHEGWHSYQGHHSSYYDTVVLYRINDSLSFGVKNFKTFPANKINEIVPSATRKKIFRYDTYVNAKDKYNVTRQFGILGLLEEAVAYYHSFATDLALFGYYKDVYGWKDPAPWLEWLGNIASYRYAIAEFELFISWYIQYAKSKYPQVYKDIVTNAGLKKLFQFLEKENDRLTALYNQSRETIIKKFNGRLYMEDNYIYDTRTHSGKGVFDKEVNEMNKLLAQPEHRVLTLLKK
jgi:hypothetical protein